MHSFLLSMFQTISDARMAHNKQARALGTITDKVTISNSLEYARLEHSVHLDLHALPSDVFMRADIGTKKLVGVLLGWTWSMAPEGTPGISWLELCVMFFLHGGISTDLGLEHRHEGQTQLSLRLVLQAFIRKFKAIAQIHLVWHSQVFFKSSKSTRLRCQSIGYSNHCACIAGLPALGDDQASELTKMLVGLRHTFTRNSSKLFDDNLLQLPPRRFSYRGAIPSSWTSSVSRFPCVIPTQVEDWYLNREIPQVQPCVPCLTLHCPLCKTPKNVWGRLLLKGTCWKQITCLSRSCRNTRTSAKWLCDCGRPWYICNIHAPLGHLSGTAPRSNPEHVTKESRKRGLIHTDHAPLPDELLRKRRHAEGHDDNHMRDRKRKTSLPSSKQNNKKRKKGDHDDAIASIIRLRASRTQAASSGEGLN